MGELLSFKELARRCNVTLPTISSNVRRGKLVKTEANLFDMANHLNKKFLSDKTAKLNLKKEVSSTKVKKKSKTKLSKLEKLKETHEFDYISDESLADIYDLTLVQIVERFGTISKLRTLVDTLKVITDYKKKDTEVKIKLSDLISRDYVRINVFGFLELMINRLFEMPESIADFVVAKMKSKPDEAREIFIKQIQKNSSKIVKDAKKEISKRLRKKYEDSN